MKNKIALLLAIVFLALCFSSTISALLVSPNTFYQIENATVLDGVQKSTYQNNLGQTMIQYKNIDSFVSRSLTKKSGELSSLAIAKEIIKEIEGVNSFNTLPDSYLLEALSYMEAVQTVSYIKTNEDGTQEYMCKEDVLSEIANIHQARSSLDSNPILAAEPASSFTDNWISSDGYMKITTTAIRVASPDTCVDERNHYYIVSTEADWLIIPNYTYEDVLALCFGTAIYDDSYTDFASLYEVERCGYCNHFDSLYFTEEFPSSGRIYNTSTASDHLDIIYPSGSGIACRVNFNKHISRCIHKDPNGSYDTSYIDTMTSYLRTRVYAQSFDFVVTGAYAHKWVGLGSIGVSFSVGAGGASASIGFSSLVNHTDYFGRILTVTYNSTYN